MNQHLDRLKRGLVALAELVCMALAAGAAIGGMVGGFRLAYEFIGPVVILVMIAVLVMIYMLGVVDQRDEAKTEKPPAKKE